MDLPPISEIPVDKEHADVREQPTGLKGSLFFGAAAD
jgi:hypothetical protein